MFKTYIILDERKKPLYIGKGSGRRTARYAPSRVLKHCGKTRNRLYILNKLAKILKAGGEYSVETLGEYPTEAEAHYNEKKFIGYFGRKDNGTGVLYNLTDGGEGSVGYKPTAETRANLRAANARARAEGRSFSPFGGDFFGALPDDSKQKIRASVRKSVLSGNHYFTNNTGRLSANCAGVFTFTHARHGEFVGTITEHKAAYAADKVSSYHIARGECKKSKGWACVDPRPATISRKHKHD